MTMHSIPAAWHDLHETCDPIDRRTRFASAAGTVTALLFAALSVGGLLWPAVYAGEAASWRAQAIAQDWFDLVVAAPALATASLWTRRGPHGSLRARLVQAGLLLYTLYVAAIYAFAIHLNALFLVYCATLGGSIFALFALAPLRGDVTRRQFDARLPARLVGGVLVGIGAVFALLWLAQLVPAATSGRPLAGLVETGLFTNPIHVLDLSFILPLHVIAGVLLWQGRDLGYTLAPVMLAFGAMMAASIGFLALRSSPDGGALPVIAGMSVLAAGEGVLLARMLRSQRPRAAAGSR